MGERAALKKVLGRFEGQVGASRHSGRGGGMFLFLSNNVMAAQPPENKQAMASTWSVKCLGQVSSVVMQKKGGDLYDLKKVTITKL
jgi:hypothetical protein